jgi:phage-related protein
MFYNQQKESKSNTHLHILSQFYQFIQYSEYPLLSQNLDSCEKGQMQAVRLVRVDLHGFISSRGSENQTVIAEKKRYKAICMSGTHNSTEFQWQLDYTIVF